MNSTTMDATPQLTAALRALTNEHLDCVLVGNAAAALLGAPVTTLDFDFMFRATPQNLRKLKAVSRDLDAVILRPYYPVSKLYRVVSDSTGLQLDFMPVLHGIRSFESLRSRSSTLRIGNYEVRVAALRDIILSKRTAGRPRDLAVLPVLERTLEKLEPQNQTRRKPKRPPRKTTSRPPKRKRPPAG